MKEPTERGDPPPPENPFAALDAREALFTGALEAAARAEHLASALRVQVMLAGFDAMLIEEAEQTGRDVRSDDPVVRSFLSHQAMTLHLTRQDVETRLEHARILRDRLPKTWAVFTTGGASERVVGAAADQSIGLPGECLAAFDAEAAALVQEQRESVVDRKLEQLRNKLAPEAAIERAERKANRRHVTARPEGDSGGVLEIHGTAVDIAAAYDALRQRAVAAHGRDGECRALGALMAEDAIDLILNGAAIAMAAAPTPADRAKAAKTAKGTETADGAEDAEGAGGAAAHDSTASSPSYPGERIGGGDLPGRKAVTAEILVIVPAETATGASNAPAELAGMGSLDADTARAIVQHARTWTRVLVDPVENAVLGIDSHERHIPSGLKKLLHARTPTCTGDDCGLPAHRADIDHLVRYEHDGRTRHDNLQLLCRKSHQDKDNGTIAVRMRDDGSVDWRNKWGGHRIVKPQLKVKSRYPKEAPF